MKVTDSAAAWPAVAHPIRRRLIDLLGDGPRTTGDLARAFPVSRFAVMKHLRVLERSGIVSARRRGRECWNALVVPSGLEFRIGPAAPPGEGVEPPLPAGTVRTAALSPFRLEQHVLVDASPGRVFDALTFNVSAWWGSPYLRSAHATNVVLEPQLGGRLFEEWGHRQGFIRGSVIAIRQDERIEVAGRIAGSSPLPAILEFRLAPAERGTRLTLEHRGVAEADSGGRAGTRALFEGAWADLVGARMRAFVERGIRSGINERPAEADALFGWF
jgi:DNA-binding transcriptional ArsR family regulator/uncharacterized protein YndB with AHSA1/START domain